jgi:hypothetical protein
VGDTPPERRARCPTGGYLPSVARRDRVLVLRSETDKSVVIIGLLSLGAGVGLLWLAERSFWSAGWASIVNNVGGLVIATGLLAVAWELLGKRAFASEVLAKARLSTDVVAAGIERVTDQYLVDVEWASLIERSTKVDIVVAYASTWRHTHQERLERIARDRRARMRIFLPDPDDRETMSILAGRFNTTAPDVAAKIREAIADFSAMWVANGADLQVYVRSGDVVFSCYRFDSRAVLTLYSHGRERRSRVPTFLVGSGNLFTFVYDEIHAIRKQSRQVFPEPSQGGAG